MKNIAHKFGYLALILLLLLLTFSRAARADGGGESYTQTVHGYQLTLVFASSAQVGENAVHIQVSDAQQQPVKDVVIVLATELATNGVADETDVVAGLDMGQTTTDGMGGMDMGQATADTGHTTDAHGAPTLVTLEPGEEAGEYTGEIVIPEAGAWVVQARLTLAGMPMVVDFPITVAAPRSGLGVGAGFATVNVVILGVAAVLRQRQSTKVKPA